LNEKIITSSPIIDNRLYAHSQDSEIKDEQQIINVINQFFESLETKDSLLMRKTTLATAFKS